MAAIGVAQMEMLPSFIQRKRECTAFYKKELTGVGDIRFQQELPDVTTNAWLVTIQTDKQQQLLDHMNANQVLCRRFWLPMNRLPMYKDCVYIQRNDHAGYIYSTCVSIPCSTNISDEDLAVVVREIKAAIG